MSTSRVRVIVAGAGYGGLLAAIRLAGKSPQADVTLVNQSDVFVERVRLHQYAANQAVKERPIAETLRGTRITFVHGRVEAIDLESQRVSVATGQLGAPRVGATSRMRRWPKMAELSALSHAVAETGALPHAVAEPTVATRRELTYDYLVYALGSEANVSGVPGASEFAYSLKRTGVRSAESLRAILPNLNEAHARLVVAGGGPTGVETAAELAESFPNLRTTLVTRGEVLPRAPGKPRQHVHERLRELGVVVRSSTPVARVDADALVTTSGEAIPFDVCVWCAGFSTPPLAAQAGLAVNGLNQVLVDPFMRSISHPDVFALGDAAVPANESILDVRMAAFTAAITGAHTADCLSEILRGRQPKPLSFAYVGQGIALGRKDVVGFNTFPDGNAHGPLFTGWFGVQLREFFVRFLRDTPVYERQWPGMFFWIGKGRVKAAQVSATPLMGAAAEH